MSKSYEGSIEQWWDEDAERLNAFAVAARKYAAKVSQKSKKDSRAFCATGEGGGIDNSCGDDSGKSDGDSEKNAKAERIAEKAVKSLDTTKGFSIHPVTEDSPATGYMVSVVKASEVVVDSKDEVTADLISKFMDDNKSQFDARPTLHVGGWIDSDDGKIYLDLSEQFDSIDDAIDAAESTDQLAIWDLNTKAEIRKEQYDGRRTKPKNEAGSVRLPDGRVGGKNRKGSQRGPKKSSRGEGRAGEEFVCSGAAVELIESARGRLGELPKIEFRNLGGAAASYVADADTIFVSPDLDEVFTADVESGWLSQDNPILHEAAHRHHVLADFASYISSASFQFSDEQRSLISGEVSRYAAKSGREFVAEALAGSWAGKKYGHGIRQILADVTNGKVTL
jgi:hypothetical protein